MEEDLIDRILPITKNDGLKECSTALCCCNEMESYNVGNVCSRMQCHAVWNENYY